MHFAPSGIRKKKNSPVRYSVVQQKAKDGRSRRKRLELAFLSLFVITVNIVKRYKQPPGMESAHWKPHMLDFYRGLWGGKKKKRHLYKNLIFKMKSDKKSYLFCSCFPQKASTPLTACFCAVVCNGYPVRKSAFITKRGRDNIQQPPGLAPFIFHIKIAARKGEKKG